MPSSKQIEEEIEQLKASLEPSITKLDSKMEEFVASLPKTVEAWMNGEVKRKVEDNAAKVTADGVEPLRIFKSEFAALIGQLPTICRDAVGKPEVWPHRRVDSKKSHAYSSGESFFPAAFRSAINLLGALLNKHGLLDGPPGCVSSWERIGSDQFRYAMNPGFDQHSYPSVLQYSDLHKSYKKQELQLEQKQQELAKARASGLWEKA